MANYRPHTVNVTAAASGIAKIKDINTSIWQMFLLKGTALSPTGAAMASGAIQVWYSTNTITNPADQTTFTDANGKYGITTKAGVALKVRFFGV
jgi:hypothetical protein